MQRSSKTNKEILEKMQKTKVRFDLTWLGLAYPLAVLPYYKYVVARFIGWLC